MPFMVGAVRDSSRLIDHDDDGCTDLGGVLRGEGVGSMPDTYLHAGGDGRWLEGRRGEGVVTGIWHKVKPHKSESYIGSL